MLAANAAWLLSIRKMTAGEFLADVKAGGRVLQTSFNGRKESALRETLAGVGTARAGHAS